MAMSMVARKIAIRKHNTQILQHRPNDPEETNRRKAVVHRKRQAILEEIMRNPYLDQSRLIYSDVQRQAIKMTWRKISANEHRIIRLLSTIFARTFEKSKMSSQLRVAKFLDSIGTGRLQLIGRGTTGQPIAECRIRTVECSAKSHARFFFTLLKDMLRAIDNAVLYVNMDEVSPSFAEIASFHTPLVVLGFNMKTWDIFGTACVDIFLMQEYVQGCAEARGAWMRMFAYVVDLLANQFDRQLHSIRQRQNEFNRSVSMGPLRAIRPDRSTTATASSQVFPFNDSNAEQNALESLV